MKEYTFINQISEKVRLGVLTAGKLDVNENHPEFDKRLNHLLERRKHDLTEQEDLFRKACRDMLRIGSYKPTGRGKPASEYLLREASDGKFPRINTVVDFNNYISLKYLVPISLWDLNNIESTKFLFRPGKEGEEFVFNSHGQTIQLRDLVTGFAVGADGHIPIVTPIKDCQQTKTGPDTRNVAATIYFPAEWDSKPVLQEIADEFTGLLSSISTRIDSMIC